MIGLWLVYDWFMIGLWLVHDWFMIGLWLVYEWFMIGLWLVKYDWLRLVYDWSMIVFLMLLINITSRTLPEINKNAKTNRRRSEPTHVARNHENKESDSFHSKTMLFDEPAGRAPTANFFRSVTIRSVLPPQYDLNDPAPYQRIMNNRKFIIYILRS